MQVISKFVALSGILIQPALSCFQGRFLLDFDYSAGSTGPSHWPELFETCGGLQQSPIDVPAAAKFENDVLGLIPSFSFVYTANPGEEEVEFVDKGKTVEAEYGGKDLRLSGADSLPFIVGRSADTSNEYTLQQFHFHWGSDDTKGSEHTFNGQRHAMEMHLVHYNSGKYDNFSQATGFEDGLLVVAVFFDVPESDAGVDDVLAELAEAMETTEFKDDHEVLMESFNLTAVVAGLDAHRFYLYPGSLTTPGCNQIVTWVLMKDVMYTTEATMEHFRTVIGDGGVEIVNNFRPTQNGNGRRIIDVEHKTFAVIGDSSLEDRSGEDKDGDDHKGRIAVGLTVTGAMVLLGIILIVMKYSRGS